MPRITSFWLDDDLIENKEFKKLIKTRGSLRRIINEQLRNYVYSLSDSEEQLKQKIQQKQQEIKELEQHLLQLQVKDLPKSNEIND